MDKIPKVLFLSKGDASRAKIAEAFLKKYGREQIVPFSAGTDSSSVSPFAAEVMSEAGIDISLLQARELGSLFREPFHTVVTLYDEAHERHPVYPFTRNLLQWAIPDPEIAASEPEARKNVFRQVRNEIETRVIDLVEMMAHPEKVFAKAYPKAA